MISAMKTYKHKQTEINTNTTKHRKINTMTTINSYISSCRHSVEINLHDEGNASNSLEKKKETDKDKDNEKDKEKDKNDRKHSKQISIDRSIEIDNRLKSPVIKKISKIKQGTLKIDVSEELNKSNLANEALKKEITVLKEKLFSLQKEVVKLVKSEEKLKLENENLKRNLDSLSKMQIKSSKNSLSVKINDVVEKKNSQISMKKNSCVNNNNTQSKKSLHSNINYSRESDFFNDSKFHQTIENARKELNLVDEKKQFNKQSTGLRSSMEKLPIQNQISTIEKKKPSTINLTLSCKKPNANNKIISLNYPTTTCNTTTNANSSMNDNTRNISILDQGKSDNMEDLNMKLDELIEELSSIQSIEASINQIKSNFEELSNEKHNYNQEYIVIFNQKDTVPASEIEASKSEEKLIEFS